MHKLESFKTRGEILETFIVLVKVWTVGASSVVLQCTNQYTNRATTILVNKLRYVNITSTIQLQSTLLAKPYKYSRRNS